MVKVVSNFRSKCKGSRWVWSLAMYRCELSEEITRLICLWSGWKKQIRVRTDTLFPSFPCSTVVCECQVREKPDKKKKMKNQFLLSILHQLTLSCRRFQSYRHQSIDLHCKSMDWFLYDRDLCHEGVKERLEWNITSLVQYYENCKTKCMNDDNQLLFSYQIVTTEITFKFTIAINCI